MRTSRACLAARSRSTAGVLDRALAYALYDDLSHYKKSGKRSAQMAQTLYPALGNLLVTEGNRRRVSIELQEPEPETTSAAVLGSPTTSRT